MLKKKILPVITAARRREKQYFCKEHIVTPNTERQYASTERLRPVAFLAVEDEPTSFMTSI
jgi:hypothetical protein